MDRAWVMSFSAGNGAQVLTSLVSVSRLYASFDVVHEQILTLKYISNQRNPAQVPIYMGLANEISGLLAKVRSTQSITT